jgi:hypothetical protein
MMCIYRTVARYECTDQCKIPDTDTGCLAQPCALDWGSWNWTELFASSLEGGAKRVYKTGQHQFLTVCMQFELHHLPATCVAGLMELGDLKNIEEHASHSIRKSASVTHRKH